MDKEKRHITACIRNSGFSGKSKVSAFNKSLYQTESEVLFNPLLLIHANRWYQYRQKSNNEHRKNTKRKKI
ncbi:MAG: hypothetical protein COY55_12175 [Flavobacteriaceae bacterium CG_4_10_14_0_8_um_filter_31_99]|nr:MAG: hypothetical protein COW43_02235 [Flavobacteriaceae bacterium CG17_big_fil_post_rev_8_21_14_2_50_31_13]PIX14631.1 MAG: hypothetical protein COZ74_02425 [Flavobacteriaceae bacterium CG_4_8_14_3_um_filter_31_8]PIZ09555.1 MAG: hypothetical protein COY55_12175 [Flavobacteriaceae bacterium CG_4_10_14_0_8_um_filter_31_99]PJC10111.1 MAG: hypothetical protein CO067_06405 [Flavobacteriaceae bacterium CG_4_9_14_0_8_um_filter_31_91]